MRTVDPDQARGEAGCDPGRRGGGLRQDGYTGATTAPVGRAAGVGSGTLFHYFGDKRSMMVAIFADDHVLDDEVVASLDVTVRSPSCGDCSTTCPATSPTPWRRASSSRCSSWRSTTGVRRAARRRGRPGARGLRRTAGAAQAVGEVDRELDPDRAGRWLLGLVDTLYLMSGDDGFDAAAEVAELRRLAVRYLDAAS